jgi:hypothetical protein
MKLPVVNAVLNIRFNGKTFPVTCMDVFDGGYGYYFDALFPKTTRKKFSTGEQCSVPELGEKCVADFVSYSQVEPRKARFLIPKY